MSTPDTAVPADLLIEAAQVTTKEGYPNREEMAALNQRRLNGDMKAREEMILRNDPFVLWFVSKYRRKDAPDYWDLVQSGRMGLMEAVDRFDHTRKTANGTGTFGTYAIWWIRRRVFDRAGDDSRTIKLPKHVTQRIQLLRKVAKALEQELGRRPSIEEISEKSGLGIDMISRAFEQAQGTTSLDAPLEGSDGEHDDHYMKTASTSFSSPDAVAAAVDEGREAAKWLRDLRDHLEDDFSSHHQQVFFMRYGLFGAGHARTLEVTGNQLGITRERVRQVCKKVFQARFARGLEIGSEDQLMQALRCIQTGLELSYAAGNEPSEELLDILEGGGGSSSDVVPDVAEEIPRATPSDKTRELVRHLQELVGKHEDDPVKAAGIVQALAMEDFNIPLAKSAALLKLGNDAMPADPQGLNGVAVKVRDSYTFAMLDNDPAEAWERQGKFFPSQLAEARKLQAFLADGIKKANAAIKKSARLTPDTKKALQVRYGIGREKDESDEAFCHMLEIEPVTVSQVLGTLWGLVGSEGLTIKSDEEYRKAEERLGFLAVLLN